MNEMKNLFITGWLMVAAAVVGSLVTVFAPEIREAVIATDERSYIREKNFDELREILDPLPALQRETVIRENYLNRWVKWKGVVVSIASSSSGKEFGVLVSDSIPARQFPLPEYVQIILSETWKPEVETLRKEDQIEYSGQIELLTLGGVDKPSLRLKNGYFRLIKRPHPDRVY